MAQSRFRPFYATITPANRVCTCLDVYYDEKPEKPQRDAKTVPTHIEEHLFQETRVTGYRLKDVA